VKSLYRGPEGGWLVTLAQLGRKDPPLFGGLTELDLAMKHAEGAW